MYNLQLKRLRKQAGYSTQAEFAEKLGIGERRYETLERQQVKLSLEDACAIAEVLNCTLDELAGRNFSGQANISPQSAAMLSYFNGMDKSSKDAALAAVQGIATLSRAQGGRSGDYGTEMQKRA